MVETYSNEGSPRINLADVPDFYIGQLQVRPRRLHVCGVGQPAQNLEPRVMQVLVALAQANEEVISRDELIDSCWEGRIVGDHALNRCIHALRRLAKPIDRPPFEIETIPRIGYRLVRCPTGQHATIPVHGLNSSRETTSVATTAHFVDKPRRPRFNITHLVAVVALILVLGAAGIVFGSLWGTRSVLRVAIVDAGGGSTSEVAKNFAGELSRFAGARVGEMTLVGDPSDADLIVRVSFRRLGQAAQGDVALLDKVSDELLWSGSVRLPPHERQNLPQQIAAKLSDILFCAVESSTTVAGLDHGTTKLYLAACELIENPPEDHLIGLLRRVVARAPQFAEGWARLAVAEASLYALSTAGPQTVAHQELRSAARSHLLRARQIDPKLGDTYVAEADLLPHDQFARRIEALQAGIAIDPDNASLYERLSSAYFRVGQTTKAIAAAERATALNPSSPANREALIVSLAHAGNLPKARRKLSEAERVWPDSAAVMNAAFSMEYRYGDARKAQELTDRGYSLVGGPSGGFDGPRIFMRARLDPNPDNIARLIRFATHEAKRAPHAAASRLQALGQFGALEEAYQVIQQPRVISHLALTTEVIFRPHLRDFRYDKRFPAVAARLGLMQYWQNSNSWPDFCQDPQLPYDCRAEAKRVLRDRRTV